MEDLKISSTMLHHYQGIWYKNAFRRINYVNEKFGRRNTVKQFFPVNQEQIIDSPSTVWIYLKLAQILSLINCKNIISCSTTSFSMID